jgi:hypothetical protein
MRTIFVKMAMAVFLWRKELILTIALLSLIVQAYSLMVFDACAVGALKPYILFWLVIHWCMYGCFIGAALHEYFRYKPTWESENEPRDDEDDAAWENFASEITQNNDSIICPNPIQPDEKG